MPERVRQVVLDRLSWQEEAYGDACSRFRCVVVGRGGGKSRGGALWAVNEGLKAKAQYIQCGGWIAPVYSQTEAGYHYIKNDPELSQLVARFMDSRLELVLKNGTPIKFLSADNPDRIRSNRFLFCGVDEAATCKDLGELVEKILRPALVDSKGPLMLQGTPKGRNGFWDYAQKGIKHEDGWTTYHFTTWDNPTLDRAELDGLKRTMPDLIYRQEIMAEFLEECAAVFRGVDDCVRGQYRDKAEPGACYVMGCDIAKHSDFTVLTIVDTIHRQVVAWQRFNGLSWGLQVGRIAQTAREWNDALVVLDSTGVGDAIYDQAAAAGVRLLPYKFTNETKAQLVETLALEIEGGRIHWPENDILREELKAFEYEILPGGKCRYNAPSGKHDDAVISLALAVNGSLRYGVDSISDTWDEPTSTAPGGFGL
jgi:hypothetical protein